MEGIPSQQEAGFSAHDRLIAICRREDNAIKSIFVNNDGQQRPNGSGPFVAICGFDGSGKTTQLEALRKFYADQGREVCVTRQPTDWYRNDPFVRSFLKNGGSSEQARVLALFAAADRHRHIQEVINPALTAGKVVLTDRYVFSSIAYFQSRGVPQDFILYINQGILAPDFSFFLDVRPDILLQRLVARDGETLKFEERAQSRIHNIRQNFLSLQPHLQIINGELPQDVVTANMIEIIDSFRSIPV